MHAKGAWLQGYFECAMGILLFAISHVRRRLSLSLLFAALQFLFLYFVAVLAPCCSLLPSFRWFGVGGASLSCNFVTLERLNRDFAQKLFFESFDVIRSELELIDVFRWSLSFTFENVESDPSPVFLVWTTRTPSSGRCWVAGESNHLRCLKKQRSGRRSGNSKPASWDLTLWFIDFQTLRQNTYVSVCRDGRRSDLKI